MKIAQKDYMLQFLNKPKLFTKLVLRQYMKVFTSKFISNNLYLLFVIFIIYLHSFAKIFPAIGISHRMTGSSLKSITG